eukprot:366336-Chlamydomonas_euryale.AAC.24
MSVSAGSYRHMCACWPALCCQGCTCSEAVFGQHVQEAGDVDKTCKVAECSCRTKHRAARLSVHVVSCVWGVMVFLSSGFRGIGQRIITTL